MFLFKCMRSTKIEVPSEEERTAPPDAVPNNIDTLETHPRASSVTARLPPWDRWRRIGDRFQRGAESDIFLAEGLSNNSNNCHHPRKSGDLFGQIPASVGMTTDCSTALEPRVANENSVTSVAIRVRTPESDPLLVKRELDILAGLVRHPNIVEVLELHPAARAVVMEFCSGGDLWARMNQPFTDLQIVTYMRQLLAAIGHLHSHKIMHGDIKPENILLTANGVSIKLCDFGLARRFDAPHQLGFWEYVGTLAYMAPEVIHPPYDERCDLWSAGILLYELKVRHVPFEVTVKTNEGVVVDEEATQAQIVACRLILPDTWNSSLRSLVEGLLTATPRLRLSSQGALASSWFGGCPEIPRETDFLASGS